jgi:hypothetical protein
MQYNFCSFHWCPSDCPSSLNGRQLRPAAIVRGAPTDYNSLRRPGASGHRGTWAKAKLIFRLSGIVRSHARNSKRPTIGHASTCRFPVPHNMTRYLLPRAGRVRIGLPHRSGISVERKSAVPCDHRIGIGVDYCHKRTLSRGALSAWR